MRCPSCGAWGCAEGVVESVCCADPKARPNPRIALPTDRDQDPKQRLSSADCGAKAAETLLKEVGGGACVDQFVQDQLLIFMALADGTSEVRVGVCPGGGRHPKHRERALLASRVGHRRPLRRMEWQEEWVGGCHGGCWRLQAFRVYPPPFV